MSADPHIVFTCTGVDPCPWLGAGHYGCWELHSTCGKFTFLLDDDEITDEARATRIMAMPLCEALARTQTDKETDDA